MDTVNYNHPAKATNVINNQNEVEGDDNNNKSDSLKKETTPASVKEEALTVTPSVTSHSGSRHKLPKKPAEPKESTGSTESENGGTSIVKTFSDNRYFYEDVVFRVNKKGGRVQFGVVIETPGIYSDQDSLDSEELLQSGEMRVMWLSDGEVITEKQDIGLADRTLVPGDIVRRLFPGKETQYGYCREINMTADVKIRGTKYVVKNVDTKRLGLISVWHRESVVCLGSWVGSIKDVEKRAVLRSLVTGCRVEITSNDFYAFKDANSFYQRDVFDPPVFYPGNIIIGKLPPAKNLKILTPNIPLYTLKRNKKARKFFVEKVYTDSVWVHWQCKALLDDSSQTGSDQQPHPRVSGERLKDLKRLNLFDACMLQISDRSYLKYSENDTLINIKDWYKDQTKNFRRIYKQQSTQSSTVEGKPNKRSYKIGHSTARTSLVQSTPETYKSKKKLADKESNRSHSKLLRTKMKPSEKSTTASDNEDGEQASCSVERLLPVDSDDRKSKKSSARKQQDSTKIIDCPSINGDDDWVSEDDDDENTIVAVEEDKRKVPSASTLASTAVMSTGPVPVTFTTTPPHTATTTNLAKVSKKLSNQLNQLRNKFKAITGGVSGRSAGGGGAAAVNGGSNESNSNLSKTKGQENSSNSKKTSPETEEKVQPTIAEEKVKDPPGPKAFIATYPKPRKTRYNYYSSLADFGRRVGNNALSRSSIKVNDELVTEALLVYSNATVVWQDGTIENNIPSTELYPIHYLDGHEYFPGDLVISNDISATDSRNRYGVVQMVDHFDRTAKVKWFIAYSTQSEPWPKCIGETEVSVYDLRDHPFFQFRPGTMVVRVANFTGADRNCTAGQIIDNYVEGKIKVWWIDGHVSMCWPQDLFEVAQYDGSDWENDSADSWETESENSDFGAPFRVQLKGPTSIESQIVTNMYKARGALSLLEDLLYTHCFLQDVESITKLLKIYGYCREVDRLLNTYFFNKSHFRNLLATLMDVSGNVSAESILEKEMYILRVTVDTATSTDEMFNDMKDTMVDIPEVGDLVTHIFYRNMKDTSNNSSQTNENCLESQCTDDSMVVPSKNATNNETGEEEDDDEGTYAPPILFKTVATNTYITAYCAAMKNADASTNTIEAESLDSSTLDEIALSKLKSSSPLKESNADQSEVDNSECSGKVKSKRESINESGEKSTKVSQNAEDSNSSTTEEPERKLTPEAVREALLYAGKKEIIKILKRKTRNAFPVENRTQLSIQEKLQLQIEKNELLDYAITKVKKACEKTYMLKSTLNLYRSKAKSKKCQLFTVGGLEITYNSADNVNSSNTNCHQKNDNNGENKNNTTQEQEEEEEVEVKSEQLHPPSEAIAVVEEADSGNSSLETRLQLEPDEQQQAEQLAEEATKKGNAELADESHEFLLHDISSTSSDAQEISKISMKIHRCNEWKLPGSEEYLSDSFFALGLCSLLRSQLGKLTNMIRRKYFAREGKGSDVDVSSDGDTFIEDPAHISDESKADDSVSREEEPKEQPLTVIAQEEKPSEEEEEVKPVEVPKVSYECTQLEYIQMLPNAPRSHKYYSNSFQPKNPSNFYKAVYKEHKLLKTSLPQGVWIRMFEDRLDLLSVMIRGPVHTPYEDGLFLIDMQLSKDYPKSPPACYYISYCTDRLNPNLYESGKVCVSLLGTWNGKDTELWGPNSTLLQVIVSIQGLILVAEPYFNEAGYEKQRGIQQACENSRMYNEMAIIKLVQSMKRLIQNPPEVLRDQVIHHFRENGLKMYERIRSWMEYGKNNTKGQDNKLSSTNDKVLQSSSSSTTVTTSFSMPDFPLLPVSRGFHLTLTDILESFRQTIQDLIGNSTAEPTVAKSTVSSTSIATTSTSATAIAPKATIEEALKE